MNSGAGGGVRLRQVGARPRAARPAARQRHRHRPRRAGPRAEGSRSTCSTLRRARLAPGTGPARSGSSRRARPPHLTPVRTARPLTRGDPARATARPRTADARWRRAVAASTRHDLDRYPHELSGGMAQRVVTATRAGAATRRCCSPTNPPPGSTGRWSTAPCDLLRAACDDGRAVCSSPTTSPPPSGSPTPSP